jgi:alanine dehydrogenase
MTLIISEEEVNDLISYDEAIRAIEEIEIQRANGEAKFTPRSRIFMNKGVLHLMSAGSEKFNIAGFKAYFSSKKTSKFIFVLFEAETSELKAIIEADRLGQIRTGASSAVATKFLARKGVERIGIIGAGKQALSQIEAVGLITRPKEVLVYSRTRERAIAFSDALKRRGFNVSVKDSYQEVCNAQVIITATNSKDPFLKSSFIEKGSHLNLIGSNHPSRAEAFPDVFKNSLVVTDSIEQAKVESGDLIKAVNEGYVSWEKIKELWEVVSGKVKRDNDEEVTIFKSHGIAIWDLAVAKLVFEKAIKKGMGKEVNFKGEFNLLKS